MEHTTIAVDLAKSVFQVAVSHRPDHLDEERRLPRDRFLAFVAHRPPATIVLEACGSAHYSARQLQPLGHAVRLLPAHEVRPYVRRNKTDRTDAKGLLEANRSEEIHPVPVKTIGHQAIASWHRLRSPWLATITARLEHAPRSATRIRDLHTRSGRSGSSLACGRWRGPHCAPAAARRGLPWGRHPL
jgi:transposase